MSLPFPATKTCRGPSHPAPVVLPLDERYWYFRRTDNTRGRHRAGQPLSPCRQCTNYHQLTWTRLQTKDAPRGRVPLASVYAYATELLERCGTYERVQAMHGIKGCTLRKIMAKGVKRVHARTAQHILAALSEQRRQDRLSGQTSERFRRAQAARARDAMHVDRQVRRAG